MRGIKIKKLIEILGEFESNNSSSKLDISTSELEEILEKHGDDWYIDREKGCWTMNK